MLTISHLTKTFGGKTAVDDLSLHIAPGEICGFIGHNGAGKTTTIKACCGILTPDSGSIEIAGTSVAQDPIACKKSLAYIPDNPISTSFSPAFSISTLWRTFTAYPRRTASAGFISTRRFSI